MSIGGPSASARRHRSSQAAGSRDVRGEGPCLAAALAHLVGGSGERFGIARDEHDVGARLRGGERDRAAEAAAAAGDQNALAVQPEAVEHSHVEDPSRSCRAFF